MKKITCLILLLLFLIPASSLTAQEEMPVVRAVLFYSPSCPHCHQVIQQDLPPLVEQYGDQLHILMVDTSKERGSELYQAMVADYRIPRERQGVPALVVEEVLLVGSAEIPQRFPALIEAGLAAGGKRWPSFAGFDPDAAEAVFAGRPANAATDTSASEESSGELPAELVEAPALESSAPVAEGTEVVLDTADPVGFVLAAILTLLMVGALGYVASRAAPIHVRIQQLDRGPVEGLLLPALLLVGLAVSLYLAYVEINQVPAVCGPVGHCNLVQSSPYARMFGIPVAVLGVVNYLLLGVLWQSQRTLRGSRLRMVVASLLALAVVGTVFSIYLTLLELFVIEAICAWCLTSALVTTLIMVIVTSSILAREFSSKKEGALPAVS